jgi:hypothetical protein
MNKMKLSRYLFLFILAITIISCSTKKNYIVKVKLTKLTIVSRQIKVD